MIEDGWQWSEHTLGHGMAFGIGSIVPRWSGRLYDTSLLQQISLNLDIEQEAPVMFSALLRGPG